MNDYFSIRVSADPSSADLLDLVASYLADAGFESFVQEGDGLTAYIPASLGDGGAIAEKALEDFPMDCTFSFNSERIEGQDWNEEWEKNYFKPILIEGRCVVHSSFHHDVPDAEYDIVIDPKMAFGTGHHDTTSQMLSFILDLPFEGKTVIDMGTGTGILGILAAFRGASEVTGIEIDGAACENTVENVRLNDVEMNVIHGDASALKSLPKADYLFANINRNIILQDIDKYAGALTDSGIMLLSGFYEEDVPMIEQAAAKHGLKTEAKLVRNRWTALELSKKVMKIARKKLEK